ncbi:MAG: STAS domain-containing protein [Megasphaera sp.]|jgi:anti-sigma B factor antagonist|nr:STAS domain-containing protein [Megasphaera sp.]MCH4187628.1 STAS domain-containing protein [Megasphaera sp.]MCH4217176.1 STAS domain-containing protein [Megasphaera sp.]
MMIDKKQVENTLIYTLNGRLDTVTAPTLGVEINELPPNINRLILDFSNVEYISSAGLRVVLSAQKKMNTQGEMKILNVCEAVNEVFELTGFSDILEIE